MLRFTAGLQADPVANHAVKVCGRPLWTRRRAAYNAFSDQDITGTDRP
jgi:hypothetical protein